MTFDTNEPCLFIAGDDERQKHIVVRHDGLPDWDVLMQNATASVITVHSNNLPDSNDNMLQLAVAVQSHPAIATIRFNDCILEELGHLCLATIEPRKQPLILEFHRCTINLQSAKTLAFMLSKGWIGELSFTDCVLDNISCATIEAALCQNQSLTRFEFVFEYMNPNDIPIAGVQGLITNSRNLVKLGLCASDYNFWDVFHAANSKSTLERLHLCHSKMEVTHLQPIVMMCLVLKSFKELAFQSCVFTEDGMEFLIKTLSNNQVVDALKLKCCSIALGAAPQRAKRNFGKLQVRKLSLRGTKLSLDTLSQTLDDVANNACIQNLDLTSGAVDSQEGFEKLCDLLRQNRGPSVLMIDGVGSAAQMIIEALQHNTSVQSLTIGGFPNADLVPFAEGLTNMRGLRKLAIHFDGDGGDDDEVSRDFLEALEDCMQENETLQTLSLRGFDSNNSIAQHYLLRIRYYLAINRVGRHSLTTAHAPIGIWTQVLARSSNEADGIYFALRENPDIVTPTRKRKHRTKSER